MRFLPITIAALLLLALGYGLVGHRTLGTAAGSFVQGQGTYLGTGYFDVFNCSGVETYATSSQASYTQVKNNVQPKMTGCTWVKSYQGDRYNRATLPVATAVATST